MKLYATSSIILFICLQLILVRSYDPYECDDPYNCDDPYKCDDPYNCDEKPEKKPITTDEYVKYTCDEHKFVGKINKNVKKFIDTNYAKDKLDNIVLYIKNKIMDNYGKIYSGIYLICLMKTNQHIDKPEFLEIATFLKSIPNSHKYEKDIKRVMPTNIKNLIWTANQNGCKLKNYVSNEYLYSSTTKVCEYLFHFDCRYMYTRIYGDVNLESVFRFEPQNGTNKFLIKNTLFPEYVYSYYKPTEYGRPAYTWRLGDHDGSFIWNVKSVDNGKYFLLLNENFKEYLLIGNIDPEDGDSRFVYTLPAPMNENDFYKTFWKLEC